MYGVYLVVYATKTGSEIQRLSRCGYASIAYDLTDIPAERLNEIRVYNEDGYMTDILCIKKHSGRPAAVRTLLAYIRNGCIADGLGIKVKYSQGADEDRDKRKKEIEFLINLNEALVQEA